MLLITNPVLHSLAIVLSMLLCDVLETVKVAAIAHGKTPLAMCAHGLGDLLNYASLALAMQGLSAVTMQGGSSLFVGSVLGTFIGMQLSRYLEARTGRAIPHHMRRWWRLPHFASNTPGGAEWHKLPAGVEIIGQHWSAD